MKCARAAEVLRGLEKLQLTVESEEIDELLALGLAVEADPDDLATARWLEAVGRDHAGSRIDDPRAKDALATALFQLEERLKSDWYRIKTSKTELARQEGERVAMRRAVAILGDPEAMRPLSKIIADLRQLAPGAGYVCCERLGHEHYALTHKGFRVRGQLKVRLARFADTSLKSFLHTFDKHEAKMAAFSGDIARLSASAGYVKKNREQIVIGLAKAGPAVDLTLQAYHAVRQSSNAPDVAVLCARNAERFGSPMHAERELEACQAALRQAGYPPTPIVLGAAKALLGFERRKGVERFVEIHRRLEQAFGRHELMVKFTARLMPAAGMPADVVGRALVAATSLVFQANRERAHRPDVRHIAVALASMVRTQDAIPEIVLRFREIELELVRAGISAMHDVEGHALECVGCPGTPREVAATVTALLTHLAAGRRAERGDVAVAVAFAKRFAY